ncbi:MAG: ketoacyl-ACP synthase III [Pirellulaceae bacterium]|nr:ketoacyl-ACP synthase III [Thermoguttaceae bacterium]MDI9446952.1 beta-ketoacyl-ACP synthase III [Planctomycetota bacterium]NLZ03302.1 ketoacyl-ACP synthase III [Pirellulaceae bacterium]
MSSISSRTTKDAEITVRRSRVGRLMGVQVVGVGSYAPDKLVRNEDLAALGCDPDWIVQRTGIVERRHAPPEIATSDMAVIAAEECIEDAGVDPSEIDLVLLGTFTPDQLLPASACLVQDRLGLSAPAMDLHAACASFAFAMITGAQFVASGSSKLVLVIGADCNSRVVNPEDKQTYPLFGDAAGAVLLAPGSDRQGLLGFAYGCDGSGAELLHRAVGGTRRPFSHDAPSNGSHFLAMEGRPVFKWAVRVVTQSIGEILELTGMTLDQIDVFIFHQANLRIIRSVIKDAGIDPRKVFNNVQRYGNTSAGSIPMALDEACRAGRVHRGDRILVSGFGAGLVWGTILIQW